MGVEAILHLDLVEIVKSFGYLGLFAIIFAESGLFFGAFLPGDSLLFTAGFLASQEVLNIYFLMPLLFAAAVLGDSVGFTFGQRFGKKLFSKEDSIFFHKKHLIRAKDFYDKHGGKTVTIGRFLPIIRTFAPIVAGMADMPYRKFLLYNFLGAFIWAVCIPLAGYFLGSLVPNVDKYLLPIVGLIIIVSVMPTIIHILTERKDREIVIEAVEDTVKKAEKLLED